MQMTGSGGVLISLAVILLVKVMVGEEAFSAWGWRLPFLFTAVLIGISFYIRMSLTESAMFLSSRSKKNPIIETFKRDNIGYGLSNLW
jgi:MFS family permease